MSIAQRQILLFLPKVISFIRIVDSTASYKLNEFYTFYRQLLLCRVALGKSFLQFSAMKMAHSPPGHHSVIGRPSAGGLHFPEYVVYRGEQVKNPFFFVLRFSVFIRKYNKNRYCFQFQAYPEYLVTYQIVKPEDTASGNEDSVR